MNIIEIEKTVEKDLSVDLNKEIADIVGKKRSNLFTWRSQFSPQLIEALIKNYASKGDVLFKFF